MNGKQIADQIDKKISEQCKLMADQMIRKAREMEPLPTFSYCRPELYRSGRRPIGDLSFISGKRAVSILRKFENAKNAITS